MTADEIVLANTQWSCAYFELCSGKTSATAKFDNMFNHSIIHRHYTHYIPFISNCIARFLLLLVRVNAIVIGLFQPVIIPHSHTVFSAWL